jgi:myo-inositol 2-dehydrogenase/D-chiro-inositol 1-dehydrogenase
MPPCCNRGSCDALVIAAPNHLHHRILMDVLPADLPILVEKPLVHDAG